MGRDQYHQENYHCAEEISIHAPHMGRDGRPDINGCFRGNFNPRAPYGARLKDIAKELLKDKFQSTRPIWGATIIYQAIQAGTGISIHAPHMGRDIIDVIHDEYNGQFQSTRPIWGATSQNFTAS